MHASPNGWMTIHLKRTGSSSSGKVTRFRGTCLFWKPRESQGKRKEQCLGAHVHVMALPCGRPPHCISTHVLEHQTTVGHNFCFPCPLLPNFHIPFVLSYDRCSPKNYALLVLKTSLSYEKSPCLRSIFSASFSCVAISELVEHRCDLTFKSSPE